MKQRHNYAHENYSFDYQLGSNVLRSKARCKSGQPMCYKTGQVYLLLTRGEVQRIDSYYM